MGSSVAPASIVVVIVDDLEGAGVDLHVAAAPVGGEDAQLVEPAPVVVLEIDRDHVPGTADLAAASTASRGRISPRSRAARARSPSLSARAARWAAGLARRAGRSGGGGAGAASLGIRNRGRCRIAADARLTGGVRPAREPACEKAAPTARRPRPGRPKPLSRKSHPMSLTATILLLYAACLVGAIASPPAAGAASKPAPAPRRRPWRAPAVLALPFAALFGRRPRAGRPGPGTRDTRIAALALPAPAPAPAVTPAPLAGPATVIDGGTLAVGGRRVRLHGIVAPGLDQTCFDAQERGYPCGRVAAQALAARIGAAAGHLRGGGPGTGRDRARPVAASAARISPPWLVEGGLRGRRPGRLRRLSGPDERAGAAAAAYGRRVRSADAGTARRDRRVVTGFPIVRETLRGSDS